MNSPFSEVSHRQSRKSIVGFVGYEFEPESRIAARRIFILTESGNCIFDRVELLCNLRCGRHLEAMGGS
jgi:hypothetical protein